MSGTTLSIGDRLRGIYTWNITRNTKCDAVDAVDAVIAVIAEEPVAPTPL